jgi:hypothetical protein
MVSAYEESSSRESERAVPHEIPILPHVFFFSCEHGDDEDDGVGIEESAFDPTEDAWPEMGEFGIEQAARNAADRDNERKKNGIFSEKRADAFAPAAVTEWRGEKHKKGNGQDIREDGEEGEEVSSALDDRCHGNNFQVTIFNFQKNFIVN